MGQSSRGSSIGDGTIDREKLQRARAKIADAMMRDGPLSSGLSEKKVIYLIMLRVMDLLE